MSCPLFVVPMNDSGDDLTMHCCQLASAVDRLVFDKQKDALNRIIWYDCYYCCSKEVGQNLILDLCAQQFVSHNPFGLMGAAIVREDHLTHAVMVIHSCCSMAAATTARLLINCDSGNHCVCSAVLAGMPGKGIPKAS